MTAPPGWVTPEDVDGFMDTTGLRSCCIYAVADLWWFQDAPVWPDGAVVICARGHSDAMLEDGRWAKNRSRLPIVMGIHEAWQVGLRE